MQSQVNIDYILSRKHSLASLEQAFEKYLAEKHINMFAFTYAYDHSSRGKNQIKYEFASSRFKVWHDHYHQEEYASIDTNLDIVRQSYLPVYWHIDQQISEAKTKRELNMRLDGKKFGAVKGICIPLHGINNEYAELLVVQMQNENFLDTSENLPFELLSSGYIYLQHLNRVLDQIKTHQPSHALLSKRQHEVLTLLAKHMSPHHIASTLKITLHTTNFHIQNINKKMGVKSKYLAVAKAKELNLI